jgi:hypothetical protein
LLLEFLEPFVDPRRSPEKDGTNKEIEWDSGGNEGYDLEKHRPLWPACTGNNRSTRDFVWMSHVVPLPRS